MTKRVNYATIGRTIGNLLGGDQSVIYLIVGVLYLLTAGGFMVGRLSVGANMGLAFLSALIWPFLIGVHFGERGLETNDR